MSVGPGARPCPACGNAVPPGAAFCANCGARVQAGAPATPAPSGPPPAGANAGALLAEGWAAARRLWPVLALIAYGAYFDYKMNGSFGVSALLAIGAGGAFLFWDRLKLRLQGFAPLLQAIPAKYRTPLLAGAGSAFFYMARLKGTQEGGTAFLTMLVILGFGLVVANYRERINEQLAPLFAWRNRVLPKAARMALVLVIPVFLTFLVAHQNLGDIGAFFGGTTNSPRSPRTTDTGFMVALTALLSAGSVFLLLNEAPPEARRGSV